MNLEILAAGALVLAAIPCALFLLNLAVYRSPGRAGLQTRISPPGAVSVLIPSRNEERNIRATLAAVLASWGVEFEVLVLDDHSTDGTAQIVSGIAACDRRLRLERAPSLPPGWCGKQHACHVLARMARHPWLVFLDADVRLAPDALARMAQFMSESRVALASGVPRQEVGTFSERLLIPLIHFLLLGFLPMHLMRRFRWAAFGAGCGQLFVAQADAYRRCGGHAQIRGTLHDGLKLPKVFRRDGFQTDLFDATEIAVCRMYRSNCEVWRGFGKNATEGLGAPAAIVPMTWLLLGGQVLPLFLLAFGPALSPAGFWLALGAAACAYLPRMLGAGLFRQSPTAALLHPFGVAALVGIQWMAWARRLMGKPPEWKGRLSPVSTPAEFTRRRGSSKPFAPAGKTALTIVLMFLLARQGHAENGEQGHPSAILPPIALTDQYGVLHQFHFPRTNALILTVADRKGYEEIGSWLKPLRQRFKGRAAIEGIASLGKVPGFLRGRVRDHFKQDLAHPVMLDWSGDIAKKLACRNGKANVFAVDRHGKILKHFVGPASEESLKSLRAALQLAPASGQ